MRGLVRSSTAFDLTTQLAHDVIPEECIVKVLSKKGKCILRLQKRGDPKCPWEQLRANVALPYRKGGGGGPSGGG